MYAYTLITLCCNFVSKDNLKTCFVLNLDPYANPQTFVIRGKFQLLFMISFDTLSLTFGLCSMVPHRVVKITSQIKVQILIAWQCNQGCLEEIKLIKFFWKIGGFTKNNRVCIQVLLWKPHLYGLSKKHTMFPPTNVCDPTHKHKGISMLM